jgi:hypothetical protein
MMKDESTLSRRKWHELFAIGTAKRRMARMGHLWRSRERKRKREREKERKRERGGEGERERERAQSAAWCHIVFAYSQPSFSSPLQLKHRFPTAHKTANIQPFYFSDPWALEALPLEVKMCWRTSVSPTGIMSNHVIIYQYIHIYIIYNIIYIYNIFISLLYIYISCEIQEYLVVVWVRDGLRWSESGPSGWLQH